MSHYNSKIKSQIFPGSGQNGNIKLHFYTAGKKSSPVIVFTSLYDGVCFSIFLGKTAYVPNLSTNISAILYFITKIYKNLIFYSIWY